MSRQIFGHPPIVTGEPIVFGMKPQSGNLTKLTPIAKGVLEAPTRPVVTGEKMTRFQVIRNRIRNWGKDPYTVVDTTRLPDKVFAGRVELPPEDLRKIYTGEVNPFV